MLLRSGWLTVCFEPLGKLLSAELPGRDLTDRFDHLCFLRVQTVAVLEQKRPGREQSHSLVAVGKGMVLRPSRPFLQIVSRCPRQL